MKRLLDVVMAIPIILAVLILLFVVSAVGYGLYLQGPTALIGLCIIAVLMFWFVKALNHFVRKLEK